MTDVLAFLEGAPGATASQVAEACGRRIGKISATLNRLVAHGLVARQPGFFREHEYRYFSTRTTAPPAHGVSRHAPESTSARPRAAQ